MTTPHDPTPETVLAEAMYESTDSRWSIAHVVSREVYLKGAREVLAASPVLREALTRGLALTPERLAAALWRVFGYGELPTVNGSTGLNTIAVWLLAALTPEATDAAE